MCTSSNLLIRQPCRAAAWNPFCLKEHGNSWQVVHSEKPFCMPPLYHSRCCFYTCDLLVSFNESPLFNKVFLLSELLLTACFLFIKPFSENSGHFSVWKLQKNGSFRDAATITSGSTDHAAFTITQILRLSHGVMDFPAPMGFTGSMHGDFCVT